jgi:nucleoid DNA-binding protein
MSNLTKRNLAIQIANQTGLTQLQVLDVIQKTFDGIVEALREGQSLEFRRFGVFEVKVRRSRIGRNPHKPQQDITIPAHRVVRFRPGKEMKAIFDNMPPPPDESDAPATPAKAKTPRKA